MELATRVQNGVPEGQGENSPAFQRRDRKQRAPSPEGTTERTATPVLSRPFGTDRSANGSPALKRRAILIHPSRIPRHYVAVTLGRATFLIVNCSTRTAQPNSQNRLQTPPLLNTKPQPACERGYPNPIGAPTPPPAAWRKAAPSNRALAAPVPAILQAPCARTRPPKNPPTPACAYTDPPKTLPEAPCACTTPCFPPKPCPCACTGVLFSPIPCHCARKSAVFGQKCRHFTTKNQ